MAKHTYLTGGVSLSSRGVHEKWICWLSTRVQGLHARWLDAVTSFSPKRVTDGRTTGPSNWPWSMLGQSRLSLPPINMALLLGLVGCTHLYDDRNNASSAGAMAVTDPSVPPLIPAENTPLDAMAPPSQKPADGDALPAGGAPPPSATGAPPRRKKRRQLKNHLPKIHKMNVCRHMIRKRMSPQPKPPQPEPPQSEIHRRKAHRNPTRKMWCRSRHHRHRWSFSRCYRRLIRRRPHRQTNMILLVLVTGQTMEKWLRSLAVRAVTGPVSYHRMAV